LLVRQMWKLFVYLVCVSDVEPLPFYLPWWMCLFLWSAGSILHQTCKRFTTESCWWGSELIFVGIELLNCNDWQESSDSNKWSSIRCVSLHGSWEPLL
jgi:hypothetical protein